MREHKGLCEHCKEYCKDERIVICSKFSTPRDYKDITLSKNKEVKNVWKTIK